MKLKILFHDNCFDGAASAAVFSRFYRERMDPDAEVLFQGVQHKSGNPFPPGAFDGDVNVCVDFRYSTSPDLHWWFDHHVSAFQSEEDRAHFEADTSGTRFYDPAARSNTKFQTRILVERFGFDAEPLRELVHWADIIDGAQFPDARTAVELDEPALEIMTWVENNKDPKLAVRLIGDLQTKALAELAAQEYIQGPLGPLLQRHRRHIDLIQQRSRLEDGVVFFDLIDDRVEAHNKFIAYMLHPTCRYTVGLTASAHRTKVSIGSNPWSPVPRAHDIARICERYGGGGHPVVGAISLPSGQAERAREIAREVVAELQDDAQGQQETRVIKTT